LPAISIRGVKGRVGRSWYWVLGTGRGRQAHPPEN
jgi:hypothetical protein